MLKLLLAKTKPYPNPIQKPKQKTKNQSPNKTHFSSSNERERDCNTTLNILYIDFITASVLTSILDGFSSG